MLLSKMRIRIPTRVKQYEQLPDVMSIRNLQKSVDAFFEARGILLPQKIMEKHAHGIKAYGFCPAQFRVNALRIKRFGLPHFKFVDGRSGYVIAPDKPGLLGVPLFRGFFRPALGNRWRREGARAPGECAQESNADFSVYI
jgi:hypothetical protein